MSKRIGIFTWWNNPNYGGFLQALATQEYLKKLGHKPEMVRVGRSSYIYLKWFYIWLRFVLLNPKEGWIFRTFARHWRSCHTIRKKLIISKFKLKKNSRIWNTLGDHYDLLLCGSDQIWNPDCLQTDYLLPNAPDDLPKISYSTSIGTTEIPRGLHEKYRKCLSKFHRISMREFAGISAVNAFLERSIEWVVDPSLLLNESDWERLLKIKRCSQKYVCCYILSPLNEDKYRQLLQLSKNFSVRLYVEHTQALKIGGNWLQKIWFRMCVAFSTRIRICPSASVTEFISGLRNSEIVISDSFHALMFSTIFHKNVKILIPENRMNMSSRITDFCEKVQYKNVIIDKLNDSIFEEKSTFSQELLDEWISASKKWLSDAINFCNVR